MGRRFGVALILLAWLGGGATAARAADPDLLLRLKLDEGGGTAAADSSQYGHHGTVVSGGGGPDWVAGRQGTALEFYGHNGSRTRYVQVPWQPTLAVTNRLTLAAWVRLRTITTGSQTVIGRANGATDWYLQVRNRGRRLVFVLRTGSTTRTLTVNLSVADAFAAGDWHHVAATYDGSRMRIYVDGTEAGRRNASGIVTLSTNASLPVGVGAQPQTPTTWRNGIPGALDDVRLYRRALSAAEIAALAAGTGGVTRLRWTERF